MAGTVQETGGFWLPSEFLDDFPMENENQKEFCFPAEFPYPETECQENGILTELTRKITRPTLHHNLFSQQHPEKQWLMSTSPNSTLSWSGGSSQVTSPQTTPFGIPNDVALNLIHHAYGQVPKMKLKEERVHVGPQIYQTNPSVYSNAKDYEMYRQLQMGPGAWPVRSNPTRIVRPDPYCASFGGAVVKRERAGTGVFLPRSYETNNNYNNISGNNERNAHALDLRRKTVSSHVIPPRAVHPVSKNFNNMNRVGRFQPLPFIENSGPSYDLVMARKNLAYLVAQRNMLMMQNERSLMTNGSSAAINREVYLPREWTY